MILEISQWLTQVMPEGKTFRTGTRIRSFRRPWPASNFLGVTFQWEPHAVAWLSYNSEISTHMMILCWKLHWRKSDALYTMDTFCHWLIAGCFWPCYRQLQNEPRSILFRSFIRTHGTPGTMIPILATKKACILWHELSYGSANKNSSLPYSGTFLVVIL